MDEEEAEAIFNELVMQLTDDEWWTWVRNWLDGEIIVDIYNDWGTENKEEAIETFRKIIKNRKEADK